MQDKTTIHMVPEPRKTELVQATYGIIGAMIEVYKNLGAGIAGIHLPRGAANKKGPPA